MKAETSNTGDAHNPQTLQSNHDSEELEFIGIQGEQERENI